MTSTFRARYDLLGRPRQRVASALTFAHGVRMHNGASTLLLLLQSAAEQTAQGSITIERSWLDTLANVAQSLVSVLLTIMIIMGVVLLFALKRSVDEVARLIRSAYEPLTTALKEAHEATSELRSVVQTVRRPVELIGATVEDANERVRTLMVRTEERLTRLDALVEIAQEEAEDVVVHAASLMHGVRAGGSSFQRAMGFARQGRSGASARRQRSRRAGARVTPAAERGDGASPEGLDAAEVVHDAELEAPRIRPRRSGTH